MQVTMTVNGEEVSGDVEPRLLLVHFVRDHLGLTGTHWGCDTSNCGTCVLWMDPVGLARVGFDGRKLAGETFNFVYTERTQTLNWPTWVLYLTLPIFAVSMTVHGLANLLEDLELVPRTPPKGFQLSELDGVN